MVHLILRGFCYVYSLGWRENKTSECGGYFAPIFPTPLHNVLGVIIMASNFSSHCTLPLANTLNHSVTVMSQQKSPVTVLSRARL